MTTNNILKSVINEQNTEKILEDFYSCRSIRNTAWKYGIEMEELYESIIRWACDCDCDCVIKAADDYKECRIEIIGRQEYDDELYETMDTEEFEYKNRQPDAVELNKIIEDYKNGTWSLYELADSYDLLINNLFRILKENGMIEKETGAKGYSRFYTEYNGIRFVWDGETEMGLIG